MITSDVPKILSWTEADIFLDGPNLRIWTEADIFDCSGQTLLGPDNSGFTGSNPIGTLFYWSADIFLSLFAIPQLILTPPGVAE